MIIHRYLAAVCLVFGLGPFTALAAAPTNRPAVAAPQTRSALPKVQRYASELIQRYDADGDGALQPPEWRPMRGQPQQIDRNGDELITAAELSSHVMDYARDKRLAPLASRESRADTSTTPDAEESPTTLENQGELLQDRKPYFVPARLLPQSLPNWYRARDADGDGQLSMEEFAPAGEAQAASQFERLDANGDGLLTPKEAVRGGSESSSQRGEGQEP